MREPWPGRFFGEREDYREDPPEPVRDFCDPRTEPPEPPPLRAELIEAYVQLSDRAAECGDKLQALSWLRLAKAKAAELREIRAERNPNRRA